MGRNKKGQFTKGETPDTGQQINEGNAREMQARAAVSRKQNKTIAEYLRTYLGEDAGNGYTRGELLVMQAVKNHKDGKLTFRDLRDLSRILGEDTLKIQTEGPSIVPMTPEAIEALSKWSKGE